MTVKKLVPPADFRVAWMAAFQAGCIARPQALEMGLTQQMIQTRLANGQWSQAHPGVYVVQGHPPSWLQEVWAAVLAVGEPACVSRESALLLAEVVSDQRVARYPIHLSAGRGRHHRVRGVVVHQLDDIQSHHLCEVEGLAVSRPERAIVDLAARAGPRWLRGLLDHLVIERHVTLAAVSTCLGDVARRGKPGVTKLGAILDDLGPGYVPPHSELEALLLDVIAAAGLPTPALQLPLPGDGPIDGTAGMGYLDTKLILEADGRRWHSRSKDIQRDHERDAQAARAGWLTLRLMWEQLRNAPEHVVATIADVRRARLDLVRDPEPDPNLRQ